jgi:hypothetical protein
VRGRDHAGAGGGVGREGSVREGAHGAFRCAAARVPIGVMMVGPASILRE